MAQGTFSEFPVGAGGGETAPDRGEESRAGNGQLVANLVRQQRYPQIRSEDFLVFGCIAKGDIQRGSHLIS